MRSVMVYEQELSHKQCEVARCANMVAQRMRVHAVLNLRPGEHVL